MACPETEQDGVGLLDDSRSSNALPLAISFNTSLLVPLHPRQRLGKIRAQILGGLNAARHSHQAVGDAYGR